MTHCNITAPNKPTLRKQLRQRRRQLNPQQQRCAAQALNRTLARQQLFLRAERIAFYLPNDGEIDPLPLLRRAHRMGKQCYLPVIRRDLSLSFKRYQPGDTLSKNRFGIPEPVHGKSAPAWTIDVVLMPLVGFDRRGRRLGMGGGFYDRTFSPQNSHQKIRLNKLVGLAHQCQEVDQLSADPWDVPLAAIATDQEFILTLKQ
jgi:5-formyltetrahydrofolate cyclo-ligase